MMKSQSTTNNENINSNHQKSFSSNQLQHSLSGSGSTQPFSSPKKNHFSSAISQSSNNNGSYIFNNNTNNIIHNSHQVGIAQSNQDSQIYTNQDQYSIINTNNESPSKLQQLENDFLDINDPQIKNTQNTQQSPVQHQLGNSLKQSQGATLNYQTASFGSNLRFNKNQTKISQVTQEEQTPQTQKSQNDPMYGTFTDISGAQDSNKLILNSELRAKLQDTNSNWKVRTEAIDEVLVILQQQIIENQARLSSQAEPLIDFIIQLLNDQNFKIVLTSLMIINKLLSLSLIEEQENVLNSQQLGRFVPHFVKKLGDSKNIIRQEAVRAIITVYEIMRRGKTSQNMLVALILPYVNKISLANKN